MSITLDRNGLSIDGRPFYLLSGVIHYFRWPRGEWRDILLKAKAGGLNTVDTVVPWNLHEPQPGQFNFADEADLPAYLDLCQELGLYAIVRPGPYICAEWENGGFPAWLTGQNLRLRTDDPVYLAAVERWFDALLLPVAARQISRGGPVILAQIENEHWASGVYGHDDHQRTLARLMHQRGIDVPLYTCMGASTDFAEFRNGWSGIADKVAATRRVWPDNPMIVSELWSGWFDSWGDSAHNGKTAASLDRVLHELTAIGASGFSHWVWAGGSNFGWWGGRTVGGDTIHMTASYDYDAPVDEFGRTTEKFYVARRHHLFLESLGPQVSRLLADARAGGPTVLFPPGVKGRTAGGEAPYRVVSNGDFAAAFLQNTGLDRQTVQVFHDDPSVHLAVEVEASSIKPLYFNLPLTDEITLRCHTWRLLGWWPQDDGPPLLVCYGFPGEVGQLQLRSRQPWQVLDAGSASVTTDGDDLTVHGWVTERPQVVRTDHATVVLLTQMRAERWWPQDGGALCGPDLVMDDGSVSVAGIRPFYQFADGRFAEFDDRAPAPQPPAREIALFWEAIGVAELETLELGTPIAGPVPFEELGCWLGYGWYSATLDLPDAVETTLTGPWLSDRATVFADGRRLGTLGVGPDGPVWTLPLSLSAGRHELRLLVDNLGRFNYGSNTGERKGLLGPLNLGGVQEDISTGWTALWQEAAFAGEAIANAKPWAVRPDAADVDLRAFPFQGSHVWLLREIEARPGERVVLQVTGDRNAGALYINGQAVSRFSRHHGGGYFKRGIDHRLRPGRNVLALHIENYAGLPWQATLLRYPQGSELAGDWRFSPGVTPGELPAQPGQPRFYRARFSYAAERHGTAPLRLDLHGLRKGHLWLNGRSLARYWQIGPQEIYKVPAVWLQDENELLVFEEEDGQPAAVRLTPLR
ncbi:MAG: beta-galactosidase [Anaerolineales bacterium]|nr:beta-galactosidase [Anaerolineales bacterium]